MFQCHLFPRRDAPLGAAVDDVAELLRDGRRLRAARGVHLEHVAAAVTHLLDAVHRTRLQQRGRREAQAAVKNNENWFPLFRNFETSKVLDDNVLTERASTRPELENTIANTVSLQKEKYSNNTF